MCFHKQQTEVPQNQTEAKRNGLNNGTINWILHHPVSFTLMAKLRLFIGSQMWIWWKWKKNPATCLLFEKVVLLAQTLQGRSQIHVIATSIKLFKQKLVDLYVNLRMQKQILNPSPFLEDIFSVLSLIFSSYQQLYAPNMLELTLYSTEVCVKNKHFKCMKVKKKKNKILSSFKWTLKTAAANSSPTQEI